MIQLIRLQLAENDFVGAIGTVKSEIEFLTTNDKCKRDGLNLYRLDLLLLYLITHDEAAVESLLAEVGRLRKQ